MVQVNIDGCVLKVFEANDFSLFLTLATYFLEAHIPMTGQAISLMDSPAGITHSVLLPWLLYGGQELVSQLMSLKSKENVNG